MKITFIALIALLTFPALALDDTTANREHEADRYLSATPPKEMMTDMVEQMTKNSAPDQRDGLKTLLLKHLDFVAITKDIKDSLVKEFTADELKALADFYGSPAGKSAMKKFGAYMADVMPNIQAEILKAKTEVDRERQ